MYNKVTLDIKKLFSNFVDNSYLTSIKVYNNVLDSKLIIINSNKNKIGIYLWFNDLTTDFYVGSSINLGRRFSSYFSKSYLIHPKNKNMIICKALNKYSYDKFSLIIIENCNKEDLVEREQYWIDNLKPTYNILNTAYNSIGYKHTEESKVLMSELAKLRTHTEDTKSKIKDALSGSNNPFFGKKHTEESIFKIIQSKSSVVYLYNEYKELMYIFNSVSELSKLINSNHTSIKKFIESKELFRGNWYITKVLLSNSDLPLITDNTSLIYNNLITDMINSSHIRKAVFVFDLDNILLDKYDSILEAKENLNISHETIKKYAKSGQIYNNKYKFSYHNLDNYD
jgi:group I intron endonuclease